MTTLQRGFVGLLLLIVFVAGGAALLKSETYGFTPLANHHTLLEGTSWYQHGLWPAEYWRWRSDAIIHRIHSRVLAHVGTLAEQDIENARYDSNGHDR
jgi:hypothetical protein